MTDNSLFHSEEDVTTTESFDMDGYDVPSDDGINYQSDIEDFDVVKDSKYDTSKEADTKDDDLGGLGGLNDLCDLNDLGDLCDIESVKDMKNKEKEEKKIRKMERDKRRLRRKQKRDKRDKRSKKRSRETDDEIDIEQDDMLNVINKRPRLVIPSSPRPSVRSRCRSRCNPPSNLCCEKACFRVSFPSSLMFK